MVLSQNSPRSVEKLPCPTQDIQKPRFFPLHLHRTLQRCTSKCGLWTSRMSFIWGLEMQILESTADLLNPSFNLCFIELPGWFLRRETFEKHCPGVLSLPTWTKLDWTHFLLQISGRRISVEKHTCYVLRPRKGTCHFPLYSKYRI